MWMQNIGVWFDIPVLDLERAKKFYTDILDVSFFNITHNDCKIALFPFEFGAVTGALVQYPYSQPSMVGTTIYLNGGKDLNGPLAKVVEAGGEILQEKTWLKEYGYVAFFKDTEGNRVGLHSDCDGTEQH